MLDDLIELVIDIGADLLEGVLKHRGEKNEKHGGKRTAARHEPWERVEKNLPWEE